MLTTYLFAVIILVICVLLLSVKTLLKKGGEFPNTHIGGNETLRKRGLHCARAQHREALDHKNLADRLLGEKENEI